MLLWTPLLCLEGWIFQKYVQNPIWPNLWSWSQSPWMKVNMLLLVFIQSRRHLCLSALVVAESKQAVELYSSSKQVWTNDKSTKWTWQVGPNNGSMDLFPRTTMSIVHIHHVHVHHVHVHHVQLCGIFLTTPLLIDHQKDQRNHHIITDLTSESETGSCKGILSSCCECPISSF